LMNNYFRLEGGSSSTSNQQAIHNFRTGNGADRVRDDPRRKVEDRERRVFGHNRRIITAISVESSPPAGLGSRLRFRQSPRRSHGTGFRVFDRVSAQFRVRRSRNYMGKMYPGTWSLRVDHMDDPPLRNLSLLASQDPLL